MPNKAADEMDFIARRLKEIEAEKLDRINAGDVAPGALGPAAEESPGDQADFYMGTPFSPIIL